MANEPEQAPSGALQDELTRRQEEAGADYEVSLESLSQWQLAWRKFRKHRLALVGMGILLTFVSVAIIGPMTATPRKVTRIARPPIARWCLRNFRHASCHWLSD